MNPNRRTLLTGLLAGAALPWSAPRAQADDWPRRRPINFVVPYPPGGVTDVQTRVLAPLLMKELGQTVVVENKGGAGGSIGVTHAARQAPDGYTMVIGTQATHGANAALYPDLRYHPLDDFVPVHGLFDSIPMLGVAKGRPYTTLRAFIDYAKANPGAIRYGSAGVGSGGHLVGEMFQQNAGIQLTHVPYKGVGPMMTDLIGGHIDASFDYPITMLQPAQAGMVQVLAFMGQNRLPALPNVPTILEEGFPLPAAKTWTVIYMPAGTPPAIVSRMADAIAKTYRTPEMQQLIDRFGGELMQLRGQALDAFSQDQFKRWREVVQRANITLNN